MNPKGSIYPSYYEEQLIFLRRESVLRKTFLIAFRIAFSSSTVSCLTLSSRLSLRLETLTNFYLQTGSCDLEETIQLNTPPYPRGGFEKTEDGDSLFGNKFDSYEELISVGSTTVHQLHNMATVMNQDIRPSII